MPPLRKPATKAKQTRSAPAEEAAAPSAKRSKPAAKSLGGKRPRVAAAAAASATSSAPCLFDRLAAVELQSVLQFLSPRAISSTAATCSRMRRETDQPLVWKRFTSGVPARGLKSIVRVFRAPAPPVKRGRAPRMELPRPRRKWPAWTASPMLRKWLPITLDIRHVHDESDVQVMLEQSQQFGHVIGLDAFNDVQCQFESQTLMPIVGAPSLQRVRSLELVGNGLTDPLFSRICSLPLLDRLTLTWPEHQLDYDEGDGDDDKRIKLVLSSAALASAKALRRVDLVGAKKTAAAYAGLAAIPQLEILTLGDCAPLYSSLAELPNLFGLAKLRRLDLLDADMSAHEVDQAKLVALLSQLPLLQQLRFGGDLVILLGALLEVGAAKLSALTQIRWSDCQESCQDWIPDLDFPLMNRVAAAFPNLRVCLGDKENVMENDADDQQDCCGSSEQVCANRLSLTCADEDSLLDWCDKIQTEAERLKEQIPCRSDDEVAGEDEDDEEDGDEVDHEEWS